MIYILIAIIVLLCIVIVCLSIRFTMANCMHHTKVAEMKMLITQLDDNRNSHSAQMVLSDDLTKKLHAARSKIDSDMISIQMDCIESLSKNKPRG